jgi:hypothetical protein
VHRADEVRGDTLSEKIVGNCHRAMRTWWA